MNIIIYCLALHAPNMNKKLIKITYKVIYLLNCKNYVGHLIDKFHASPRNECSSLKLRLYNFRVVFGDP